MKKSLFMILLVSVFISCNSLNEDISDIESNSSDPIELNQPGFMDPTQIWGDPDGTGSGGGSGGNSNSITGDCDNGSFVYFFEEVPGVKFKITGEYYMEGSIKKVRNLKSDTMGQTPDSEIYVSFNYDTFSNTFRIYMNYTILSRILDYNMEWQNITSYYSDDFTINPCQQTIY